MALQRTALLSRFREAIEHQRLAHAYLLLGRDRDGLNQLVREVGGIIVGAPLESHPDVHTVRPESKSRRIVIEQMRQLEEALLLKSYSGAIKLGIIYDAERMCLGTADAANAFLKTLEEPPERTVLLLTSTEPTLILPTILSRCIRLQLQPEPNEAEESPKDSEVESLLKSWWSAPGQGFLRGYARSVLLTQAWSQVREQIQEELAATESLEEEALKALVEAEVLLWRRRSICRLQEAYWSRACELREQGQSTAREQRAIILLDELNQALNQNVDATLAAERTCLAMERGVPATA